MARPLRIEYKGAYYHVLSRGNNRARIFKKKEDYQDFLDLLEQLSERFSIAIYAYVLMNNHYHLLLRTHQGNLSKAMQWLGTSYTRRFNVRHKQSGHLFQGRFKSILVEDDAYLINLSCYIHCNPLRARMVKRLAVFQWSSYPYYAYEKGPPAWLDIEPILAHFGKGRARYSAYRDNVKHYSNENESIWENIKFGFIYGSQAFIDRIQEKYLSDKPDKELPQLNQLLHAQAPEGLIGQICEILDCDIDEFKQAGRLTGEDCAKRDVLVRLLWETGRYSNRQIGEFVGLSYSSVSKRLSQVANSLKSEKKDRTKKIYTQLSTKIKV